MSIVRALVGFVSCALIVAGSCTRTMPLVASAVSAVVADPPPPPPPSSRPRYPLAVSTNRRYLVDQDNIPFLMVGDAPQTLVANLSVAEAEDGAVEGAS